jgi:phosphoribosylformylglycinamidine synthase
MGELVRAAEAAYDGALAYRAPFISGKDSLNNQFTAGDGTTIEIPPTLLISGMGVVPDVSRCVTMDAKSAGNHLVIVGKIGSRLDGSHYEMLFGPAEDRQVPVTDLERGPLIARRVHAAIAEDLVASAHDCSDGGLLVAAAEMAMAGGLGLDLETVEPASCFSEEPSRYLLEVAPTKLRSVRAHLDGVPSVVLGSQAAWLGTLDW